MIRVSLFEKISDSIHNIIKKMSRKSFFEDNQKTDQDFVFGVIGENKLPSLKQLKYINRFYGKTEILATKIALAAIAASITVLAVSVYKNNITEQPAAGGEYAEAVIGAPTYINPLFSQANGVDQDLTKLIFSSLIKINGKSEPVGDLAQSWKISEDQKNYTFTIKPKVKWHDGEELTADDIIFTIQKIQDKDFKSPLYETFRNIKARKIDQRTVRFTLAEPFAPFLSILTFGILPEHLWQNINPNYALLAELNLKPIGSGPYKFSSFTKDKNGNIRQYTLERFDKYHEDGPFISKITLKFFSNFESAIQSVREGNADGIGILPQASTQSVQKEIQKDSISKYKFSLNQYTALFFNQKSNEFLEDKKVRQALSLATSKQEIIDAALSGFAETANSPILPGMTGYSQDIPTTLYDPAKAEKILDEAGYKRVFKEESEDSESEKNEKTNSQNNQQENTEDILSQKTSGSTSLGLPKEEKEKKLYTRQKNDSTLELTITTIQKDEMILIAEKIRELWQSIGVKINLQIIKPSKIQKEVISPRAYQALLFGQILGNDPDPYPFWHSSQANEQGLNLAMYSNKEIDSILEEARRTSDEEKRAEKYIEFQQKLLKDIPAIFLYTLQYTYLLPSDIKGVETKKISNTSDRFSNIEHWYIKTKKRLQF